ncbi:MAG: hypothetical protein KGY99_10505 [Phycisphaerae bacterium]|nr:hypothetical protein [Phycisphaerae bacterium]
MVLADIRNFLYAWQLPLVLVFLVGWIWGGGYLLHRALRNTSDAGRAALSRCLTAIFLAGLGGAVGGGVLFLLVQRIAQSPGHKPIVLPAVVGGLAALGLAYLVIFAMFTLSAGRTLRAVALPMGAVVALAALVGTACGVPAWYIRQGQLTRDRTLFKLDVLYKAVEGYRRRNDAPPPSLQALVDAGAIAPQHLRSPTLPDREVGFFYLPQSAEAVEDARRETIVICAIAAHDGQRAVCYADGRTEWLDEAGFQRRLGDEPNKAFAEALRAAG